MKPDSTETNILEQNIDVIYSHDLSFEFWIQCFHITVKRVLKERKVLVRRAKLDKLAHSSFLVNLISNLDSNVTDINLRLVLDHRLFVRAQDGKLTHGDGLTTTE